MKEIENNSIDLIFTSPPYNLETKYEGFKDNLSFSDYKKMITKIIKECSRIIKDNGKFIVEVADSIMSNGTYIQLAALIQSISIKNNFVLVNRNVNFIKTKNKIEHIDHGFKKDFSSNNNVHSNCHQILIFSKNKSNKEEEGKILYFNYKKSKYHNCPFPKETINYVLDKYFKKGNNVLDPFMGIAVFGKEVLKRKGSFYGYEISKTYFRTAKKNLQQILLDKK